MLSLSQRDLCKRTISPSTFYLLVQDALASKKPLSVVRMGDGERSLLKQCQEGYPEDVILPSPENHQWLKNLCVIGITKGELSRRILKAAKECTYFAPSISGIENPEFFTHDISPYRSYYPDNFFVNQWTEEMKADLFKQAGHVLLIHRSPNTADSMQLRVQANLGVKVSFIGLSDWSQTSDVIKKASEIDTPLVIFSAGPAGKYIGPEIAKYGRIPKVVLDLGHTTDSWTFEHLPADREKAEQFHAEWESRPVKH
jgi:hypothetical protein